MKTSYLSGSYYCTSFLPPLFFCFALLRFNSHIKFHTSPHDTAQILVDKSEIQIQYYYTIHKSQPNGQDPCFVFGRSHLQILAQRQAILTHFLWRSSSSLNKCLTGMPYQAWLLLPLSLPVYYILITLSLNTTHFELLILLSNKPYCLLINWAWLHVKLLCIIYTNLNLSNRFQQKSPANYFMKIGPAGVQLFHADQR